MTKTQHTFDLSSEQSLQLAKTGSCVVIEPMDLQPKLFPVHNFYDARFNESVMENAIRDSPYQPGQSVTIRQEWPKIYYNHINSYTEQQSASTMPEHLHIQATIQTVDVRQCSEIGIPIINKIAGEHNYIGQTADRYEFMMQYFKDWFNQQFSTPRPVECKECDGDGEHSMPGSYSGDTEFVDCSHCNGDGIESYISYVYDEKEIHILSDLVAKGEMVNTEFYSEGVNWEYKDKPLTIITNPYLRIIKIGAVEK